MQLIIEKDGLKAEYLGQQQKFTEKNGRYAASGNGYVPVHVRVKITKQT